MAKRLVDILISSVLLLALLPVLLILALLIRLDSKGAVIYSQERIGRGGKPFTIYKFRTMQNDAEDGLPQLAARDDRRITNVGKVLRRYHLDELPQLWNVLKGEMSLVGPRPERRYYIDQIMAQAPEYAQLLSIRPGLSSWGMIRYGYASDIRQMIERMHYDLKYVENQSLWFDLKIILYTIKNVLTGQGV